MFDPLDPSISSAAAFGGEDTPPWPTTPHSPGSSVPNLRRAPSPLPPTPDKCPSNGPYGREPQIYGKPEPGIISPRDNVTSNGTKLEKTEPYLRVRITGLDRNRRDILVKFDAQTNLTNFTGTAYRNVSRSYLECQQFYESIVTSNPQTIVPALPLAQTSAPTDEEDDRLVKIMLQRWITRVCEDPILITDEDVRAFIESDFGYQPTPRPRRKTSSGFGLIRRNVPDEDEELLKARYELTKLEGQFFETAKSVDKVAVARKALATAHAEMGNKLINVATTEAHPPLANALRKIGRAWHSLADLDHAQGISECVVIGDTLGYQGMNARSAKETLQQRTGVLEEYQAAVKTTISKRRQIERLKASSNIRPDRVDEALEEIEEADRYERILARRAEGISQNLHLALRTYNRCANDDLTSALIEHARSSIMYEKQLLRELEALRADVSKAADKVLPPVNGVPMPKVVPPLEDYSAPPRPPPTNSHAADRHGGFGNGQAAVSPSGPPSFSQPRAAAAAPPPPNAQPSPNVDPLSSNSTHTFPAASSSASSFSSPRPPQPHQSPGAGPSSPTRFRPLSPPLPAANEPPLGGRFVDGTKSMFVKPTSPLASPPVTSSAGFSQDPLSQGPSISRLSQSTSFMRTPNSFADPLLGSASGSQIQANGDSAATHTDFDPLGQGKPGLVSSVRAQPPARPRLDAREAASKLANMF